MQNAVELTSAKEFGCGPRTSLVRPCRVVTIILSVEVRKRIPKKKNNPIPV